MLSGSKKRHHFVPRLYLKRFVHPKTKNLLIHEYKDGVFIKEITPSLNAIMLEKYIYKLDESFLQNNNKIHSEFVETYLLERLYERTFEKGLVALCDNDESINQRIAWRISSGILSLYLRNPVIRDLNKAFALEGEGNLSENDKIKLNKFAELTAVLHIKMREQFKMRSVFFRASGIFRFITSDHPPVPCEYNSEHDALALVYKRYLHAHLLSTHSWPENIGLLCALNHEWCVFSIPATCENEVEVCEANDFHVAALNNLLMAGANRWVVMPYWFGLKEVKVSTFGSLSPVLEVVNPEPKYLPGSLGWQPVSL